MKKRPRKSAGLPAPGNAEFSFFHRVKFLLLLTAIALFLEASLAGVVPLSASWLVDKVFPVKDPVELYKVLVALGAGAGIAAIAGFLRVWLASRAQSRTLASLRYTMFERVQRLSLSASDDADARDVLSRFSTDFGTLETAAGDTIQFIVLPCLEALVCAGLMIFVDWRVGLVSLVLSPWIMLTPMLSAAHAGRSLEETRGAEKNLLGLVRESIKSQAVVRAFALEKMITTAFRKRNGSLSRQVGRARLFTALMERLGGVSILCVRFAIVGMSAWFADGNTLTAGAFVALQLLSYTLSNSLFAASGHLPALRSARAALKRIRELLYTPLGIQDAPGARFLPEVHSEIGFSDLHFSYGEGGLEQLSGMTARIPRGAYVAFVGPSGCGKSTLLKLLMRFYDPSEGRITIDGHDLKSVTQGSLRSRMGFVLQANSLFNVSIRENIRIGRPDASEEAVVNAARAAGLHEIIMELSHGYDSLAGNKGVRFSAAGLQRLAIARAMLRDPEILLLDEVTSSLDPADEAAVSATLAEVRTGRTVIAVTHRLSTAADAEHIFFMDNGNIVEQGSHFELMAADGIYASYWRKQAGFTFSSDGAHVDVDAERLKAFPILDSLDDDALAELAPFFATETFPPRREIVRQNDPGDKFYIIARGQVEVWRTEEKSGATKKVAVLQDGDFFGEITLLTGFPRTATVRTLTSCTCISLERGHFNRLLAKFPELQRKMSEVAVKRLRETSRQEQQTLAAVRAARAMPEPSALGPGAEDTTPGE